MQKTLAQLREESYLKADLKNGASSVPTALANVFVNEAWAELYDKLISADDGRLFAINATIPPKVGEHSFRLPWDFKHLCSLHIRRGNYYVPGVRADAAQMAELADNEYDFGQPRYFVRENPATGEEFVFIYPEPAAADVSVTYFPECKYLSLDSDELANKGQRLEYVTLGTAIRMLNRIERDASQQVAALKACEKRIVGSIHNMDMNSPKRIRELAYRHGNGMRYGRWSGG
jgi:hypothetical protein